HADRRARDPGPARSQSAGPRRSAAGRLPGSTCASPESARADGCRPGGCSHRPGRPAVRPDWRSAAHRRGGRGAVRDPATMIWASLLVASVACYAIKLAGLSLPQRFLEGPRVQRIIPLLPVALRAALVATQTFATGRHLVLDVRAAALAVAAVAVLVRAPFLAVVVAGAATAALLRLV